MFSCPCAKDGACGLRANPAAQLPQCPCACSVAVAPLASCANMCALPQNSVLSLLRGLLRPKYRKHVGFTPEKKYDPVDRGRPGLAASVDGM